MTHTPLFIPLKAVEFDAFASGAKIVEYRREGGGHTLVRL